MTTVGFGDIVLVAIAARLVTGLEAIVGQIYVAVGIAASSAARRARARPIARREFMQCMSVWPVPPGVKVESPSAPLPPVGTKWQEIPPSSR